MAAAVGLRWDFDGRHLRALAKATKGAAHARRLLALAEIYDGRTRTDAARIGGVGLQTVRDWVLRFNAQGPEGRIDRTAPGQPSKLKASHRAALAAVIESGPIPAVHGVGRWRLVDLIAWLFEEFRVSVSKQTLSRELRALGPRKLSARPRHHQRSEAAVSALKKTSRPAWRRSRPGRLPVSP